MTLHVPTHADPEGKCIASMDGVEYAIGTMDDPWALGPYIAPTEHYALLRHTAKLARPATAVEFGVGSGQSTRILAEHMPVIGFDSGEGLPEDWRPEYPRGSFAHEIPDIPRAVIVKGWFADTLPAYKFGTLDISLVHFDADLYSSTATALQYVGPHLHRGTYVVFDEWHSYPEAGEHEQRAWREFAEHTGITWEVVGHSREAWSIRIA